MNYKARTRGFTLIELLVVIAIIGILSTLAIVALSSARQKARDSKRVADMNQITRALELYYNDSNSYPTLITPGQPLAFGSTTYLAQVPSNPVPQNDGDCSNNNYTYASSGDNNVGYAVNFCLGAAVSSLPKGFNYTSMNGFNGDPTLIGWWKLDEGTSATANDTSASKNNALFPGTSSDPSWVTGRTSSSSKALSFDNSDDYIQVAHNSNQLLTNGGTITAWINPIGIGSTGRIVDKTSSGAGGTGYTFNTASGTRLQFIINAGSGALSASSSLPLSQWSMATVTWDATGLSTIYINGVANGTPAVAGTPSGITTTNPLRIGNRSNATGNTFNGSISDVRVYNRPLSAAEILALYNATR